MLGSVTPEILGEALFPKNVSRKQESRDGIALRLINVLLSSVAFLKKK
jgi:hypothetical protein